MLAEAEKSLNRRVAGVMIDMVVIDQCLFLFTCKAAAQLLLKVQFLAATRLHV